MHAEIEIEAARTNTKRIVMTIATRLVFRAACSAVGSCAVGGWVVDTTVSEDHNTTQQGLPKTH